MPCVTTDVDFHLPRQQLITAVDDRDLFQKKIYKDEKQNKKKKKI